jgi:hypothetical protein
VATRTVTVRLRADISQYTRGMRQAADNTSPGSPAPGAAVGTAMVTGFAIAAAAAAKFDKSLSNVRAVTGASSADMKRSCARPRWRRARPPVQRHPGRRRRGRAGPRRRLGRRHHRRRPQGLPGPGRLRADGPGRLRHHRRAGDEHLRPARQGRQPHRRRPVSAGANKSGGGHERPGHGPAPGWPARQPDRPVPRGHRGRAGRVRRPRPDRLGRRYVAEDHAAAAHPAVRRGPRR